MPVSELQEKIFEKPVNYGTGDKLVSYFTNVALSEHDNDDFVLLERKPLTPLDFS